MIITRPCVVIGRQARVTLIQHLLKRSEASGFKIRYFNRRLLRHETSNR